MRPAPLLCPGCGAVEPPIVRIAGYPSAEARALLDADDAEIAGGCIVGDDPRPVAPLRCRRCRRLLADAGDDAEVLAELAVGGAPIHVAGDLWASRDGRAVCVVLPLVSDPAEPVAVGEGDRAALLAARRAIVVVGVQGHAARFVVGWRARALLRASAPIELPDRSALGLRSGVVTVDAVLRPRHRR